MLAVFSKCGMRHTKNTGIFTLAPSDQPCETPPAQVTSRA